MGTLDCREPSYHLCQNPSNSQHAFSWLSFFVSLCCWQWVNTYVQQWSSVSMLGLNWLDCLYSVLFWHVAGCYPDPITLSYCKPLICSLIHSKIVRREKKRKWSSKTEGWVRKEEEGAGRWLTNFFTHALVALLGPSITIGICVQLMTHCHLSSRLEAAVYLNLVRFLQADWWSPFWTEE